MSDRTTVIRAHTGGVARSVWDVEVEFTKGGDGRYCSWVARRSKRRTTTAGMGVGHRQLPHDLAQFVVEAELGLSDGFWGSVEQGATFKSLDRRRTEPGKAVIERNREALDRAEAEANRHTTAWQAGQPTPVAGPLDDALARWLALGDGQSLTLTWPTRR